MRHRSAISRAGWALRSAGVSSFFQTPIAAGGVVLLGLALLVALGFEFVNGFHDTANAVATVIYTKSLKPVHAAPRSGARRTRTGTPGW
jgi:hypothetical protein